MFEFQILIPVYGNDGRMFSAEEHDAFESVLAAKFGGFSLQDQTVTGAWVDDSGKTYRDRLRVYVVSVKSIGQGGDIAEVARFAKAHYRQEAVYLRYLGVAEIL